MPHGIAGGMLLHFSYLRAVIPTAATIPRGTNDPLFSMSYQSIFLSLLLLSALPAAAQTIIPLERGGSVRSKTIDDYRREMKGADRLRTDSAAYSDGLRLAFNALYRDSLDEAERRFTEALKDRPEAEGNYIIRYNLALIDQARGHSARAVDALDKILKSHPDYVDARLLRAEAELQLDRAREAVTDAEAILDLGLDKGVGTERLWRARFVRAAARYQLRLYPDAAADVARLLKERPGAENVRLLDALILQRMGRNAEALNRLNLIVSAHPKSIDALSTRAAVLAELDRPAQARADYDALIALAPDEPAYYIERARMYVKEGEKTAARRDLDRAVKLGTPRGVVQALYNLTR